MLPATSYIGDEVMLADNKMFLVRDAADREINAKKRNTSDKYAEIA